MRQYRQGDLLFVTIDFWPEDSLRVPTNVLGEGEKKGHRHVLEAPGELFLSGGGLVFRAPEPAVITHPEHATLELPSGHYRVLQQREYRPQARPRYVYD